MTIFATASAIAVAYFLAARLGLTLLSTPSDVAVFWPASGIAAGLLLALGRRVLPALVIGVVTATIAANLLSDRAVSTAVFKGFCNAGEAVLMAWLLERWFGSPFAFADLRRVLGFLAATALATAASAVGGTLTIVSLHAAAPFWETWRTWFLSDAVGLVVIGPLVVGLGQMWREPPSRAELLEGLGWVALMTLVTAHMITHRADSWLSFSPGCIELPLLLWLSARYPPVFALSSASLVSMIVIGATVFGIGRFGDESVPATERVYGAQLTVTTITAFTLVLVGLFAERRSQQGLLSANNTQLRNQEEAFRRLLGALPAAIYTADNGGYITYCNQAAVDFWGRRPEIGKDKWSDLCRLRYADGTPMPLDECATQICLKQRRAVVGQEAILERPDGSTVPFIPYPVPLLDAQGTVVGVVNMKVDITERKRAEHALAERNLQLSLAGKAALVGSYSYDVGAEALDVSEGYAAVHGLPEGTEKSTRREWRARAHPEDVTRIEKIREQAFRDRREEYSVEYRIVRPVGEVRWIESRSFIAYAPNGQPLRVVGVNIDITERKRAEAALCERTEQLELASKFARVGSFAVDYGTNHVRLSPGCATLYGLPENTVEMSPIEARGHVHPDDRAQVEAARNAAFREQRQDFIAQFRIIRADNGEVRWVESRSRISYGKSGRPTGMVGVSIDVTDRKHAEDHKSLLISELDHRVKNALACVGAIVDQTHAANKSMDGFLEALRGRLGSLANTHALLSHNRWEGVGLAELVHGELAPCMRADNTVVEGPAIYLTADAVQTVAIVLHELATNATKYGALSNRRGRVSVRWGWCSNEGVHDVLALEWHETDGPPAPDPPETGYGTSVIRDLIPYELGGTVDYVLAADGVRCRLAIPAKWLRNSTQPHAGAHSRERLRAVS